MDTEGRNDKGFAEGKEEKKITFEFRENPYRSVTANQSCVSIEDSQQIEWHKWLCENAIGRCLNIGLGCGVAWKAIAEKCESQLVIEKYIDVVEWNINHFGFLSNILLCDWRDGLKVMADEYFDFLYFDVYPFPEDRDDISEDNPSVIWALVRKLSKGGIFSIYRKIDKPLLIDHGLELIETKYFSDRDIGQKYRRIN